MPKDTTPNPQDPIYSYQPLWGSWLIEEQIGKGAFGTVYKIKREEPGFSAVSAVKIIRVPSEALYMDALSMIGDSKEDLKEYFLSLIDNIKKEIAILYKLRLHPNIVIYEDHKVIEKEDELSWDILIRMEYLKSLPAYLQDNSLSLRQVIKLAVDILNALSECSKHNIVHRDIKDENIFVTEDRTFKLGDFGIAKELSKSASVASFHGTPVYISPEIVKQEEYDIRADIYSLGIVLYKLLNKNRIPFAPPYPEKIKPADITTAIAKRLRGEPIKAPAYNMPSLSGIILKACAFNKDKRYKSPMDMIVDLEKALPKISPKLLDSPVTLVKGITDESKTDNIFSGIEPEEKIEEEKTDHILPPYKKEKTSKKEPQLQPPKPWYKKVWAIATSASVFVIVLTGIILISVLQTTPTDKDISNTESDAVAETSVEDTSEREARTAPESTISNETNDIDQDNKDTAETAVQNEAPTIKLEIIEGPTSAEGGNICYYRIKATVTGSPSPTIKFSKDDSNGSFGANVSQVNLNQGESYTLTASARNDAGTESDSIKLEWEDTSNTTGDILYNVVNGAEFNFICFLAGIQNITYSWVAPTEYAKNYASRWDPGIWPTVDFFEYSKANYLNCRFDVRNYSPNIELTFKLYKNGNFYDENSYIWENQTGDYFETEASFYVNGPGTYHLEIYYNYVFALSASCIVK